MSKKTNYNNLSSDVLIKKINSMFKQIEILELFIKENNDIFQFEKKDKITEDMQRIDLEYTCDIINIYNNKLKMEQTRINKLLEEKKKCEEKNKIVIKNTDEDDEEKYDNIKKEFPIIVNLEELKRSFFSPDNEEFRPFENIIVENSFKFYKVVYKYGEDMYKKPDYMALNLNNGFVQRFEDYKKYLFVCFRCFKENDSYEYISYWLFNSTERIENVFERDIEDFQFEEIKLEIFIENFKKNDENNINYERLINEKYLH